MTRPGSVLVTGGAQRIGEAICRRLAAEGMDVVVHFRNSGEAAANLAASLKETGVESATIQADLGNPARAESLVAAAAEALGKPIEAVVNNASAFPEVNLAEATYEDLDAMMRLHAWAPLAICRALATQGGVAAVNLLDTRIVDRDPGHVPYLISKQALAGLTKSLAHLVAPMRVNGVAPGPILPAGDGSNMDAAIEATVLQRSGTPEEIADATCFLLFNEYTTGQILFVDGGRHMR